MEFEPLDPLAQALQESGIYYPLEGPKLDKLPEPKFEPQCHARACAETILELTQELEKIKKKFTSGYHSGYKKIRKENRDLQAQVERERAVANYWKAIAKSYQNTGQ